jgi:hypothetical protein
MISMLVSTSSNAYKVCKNKPLTNDRDEKERSIIDMNNKLHVQNSPEVVVDTAPERLWIPLPRPLED